MTADVINWKKIQLIKNLEGCPPLLLYLRRLEGPWSSV